MQTFVGAATLGASSSDESESLSLELEGGGGGALTFFEGLT